MTGADLRKARNAAGLSQTALAQRAGIGRHAVSYWECKTTLDRRGWAVTRMLKALDMPPLPYNWTPTRARGDGVLDGGEWFARQLQAYCQRATERAAMQRVVCGAKTRQGSTCRNMSEPGKRRCKFHGGKSTGPRTAEGRARIAEAQRRRWAATLQLP